MRRWLLFALLCACRTPPLSGAAAPGSCSNLHHLEPVAIDTMTQTDLNICPGTRTPVQITYHHGSCEPPMPVLVAFDASGAAVLTARVWRGGDCADSVHETATVNLSDGRLLSAGMLPVRDGAPGSATNTIVAIQAPPPNGPCSGPNGFQCDDAQCQHADPATRCDLDQSACVPICRADGDCPAATPRCQNGICFHGPTSCASVTCTIVEHCVVLAAGAACRPANTTAPGAACATDGDCGPGGLCQGCACLIPCASDGDCAAGHCDPNAGCV